jgi:predicted N-acetyltransferase YhbS
MIIRLETEKDWRNVENVTREAFWNVYRPGCLEHYIVHQYRQRPDFVKEFDYVLEEDGTIIGHIMYSKAQIQTFNGQCIPVMTFGPVSVLPALQRHGYGSQLIRHTMGLAADMGCPALAIVGNPQFYKRFGFVSGHTRHIVNGDFVRCDDVPFFLVTELQPGSLDNVRGIYREPDGYRVDEAAAAAFDQTFPPKEKRQLPAHDQFIMDDSFNP